MIIHWTPAYDSANWSLHGALDSVITVFLWYICVCQSTTWLPWNFACWTFECKLVLWREVFCLYGFSSCAWLQVSSSLVQDSRIKNAQQLYKVCKISNLVDLNSLLIKGEGDINYHLCCGILKWTLCMLRSYLNGWVNFRALQEIHWGFWIQRVLNQRESLLPFVQLERWLHLLWNFQGKVVWRKRSIALNRLVSHQGALLFFHSMFLLLINNIIYCF